MSFVHLPTGQSNRSMCAGHSDGINIDAAKSEAL